MDVLLQQVLNGLTLGGIYGLVALGLTLVYGILHVPNFAHGAFYMVGAFVAFHAMNAWGLGYWLAMLVAAARANGLLAIDGVFNRIDDTEGLAAEAAQGKLYGFDGKSLIHPSQIAAANAAFSPSENEVAQARAIVAAFAAPEAEGQGAIRVNGAMVERLHLDQAQALLARAEG